MTTTRAATRRQDLAEFLRSRRARLRPAEVGLPPGLRRRTPGLRREEVAQLAGVGVTWYTWLEQGRPINASVQILDAVARALRLDRVERAHLYRLAKVPAVPDEGVEDLAPEVQLVLDSMVPLPAVVYNGRFDVLAWNRTYRGLFPVLFDVPSADYGFFGYRNALWLLATMPEQCQQSNREAQMPGLVATFRNAFGRHLNEPSWTQFVRRLIVASPRFAQLWATHDVAVPSTQARVFDDVLGRSVRTVSTAFAVAGTPEARMIVYTPVDSGSRAVLAELTETVPADPGTAGRPAEHGG